MSFQVGIGFLGGTVFFQVGLCTPLQTMVLSMSEVSNFISDKRILQNKKENIFGTKVI